MTTGSGSSFPIVRLAAKYNQQITDGVVLSNRAAVDVIDTRIKQLLERIDLDEAPERFSKLYGLWKDYSDALVLHKEIEATQLKGQIDNEFEKIYHDYAAWNQIFGALDLRSKMVEREVKVLQQIKAIMTAEDGYELATKLLAAVMRVVGDDPRKMKQVQYEFTRIIGESSDHVTKGFGEEDGGDGEADGGEEGPRDLDQEELLHTRDQE